LGLLLAFLYHEVSFHYEMFLKNYYWLVAKIIIIIIELGRQLI
jgi:hypothetical protein